MNVLEYTQAIFHFILTANLIKLRERKEVNPKQTLMFPQQLDINRDGVNVPILKIKIKTFPKCALFFKNERAFEMHVLFHLKKLLYSQ